MRFIFDRYRCRTWVRSSNILTKGFIDLLSGKLCSSSLKSAKSQCFDIPHNYLPTLLDIWLSLRIGNNANRKNKNIILTSLKVTTCGGGFRFPLRNYVFLLAYNYYSRFFLFTAVCRRLENFRKTLT